jgi:hypothetical protein
MFAADSNANARERQKIIFRSAERVRVFVFAGEADGE